MNRTMRMAAVMIVLANASACGRSRGPGERNRPESDGGLDGGDAMAGRDADGSSAPGTDGGGIVVPPGPAVCGNGRLESGEQCDGRVDQSCADLGFGGGRLICDPTTCLVDATGCSELPSCMLPAGTDIPPVCGALLCACDRATFMNCDAACLQYIECALEACGPDGVAGECPARSCGESPELRAALGLLNCVADNPLCSVARPPSRCGNGVAERGELCDGADTRGQRCDTLGHGDGMLGCTASCEFDTSSCSVTNAFCGDGQIEGSEMCDRNALAGESCESLGFRRGELRCNGLCNFDTTGCERCGNTRVESGEQCDGANLAGQSCVTLGFTGGVLRCDQSCQFDDAACARCGDGQIGAGENCDGEELQGASCESLGLGAGTLACSPGCHYDTRECNDGSSCGDGVAGVDEQCDGTDLASQDCASLGLGTGELHCNEATCRYDSTGCMREPDLACANACIESACENVLKVCAETPGCEEVRVCLDGCREAPIPSCTEACSSVPNAVTPAIVAADCLSDCFQSCL